MRKDLLLLLIVLLAGCESLKPALPEGYSGPTAILKDSAKVISGSKVDFYMVERINGNRVKNSQLQTEIENSGRGFNMTPVILQRPVAAAPLQLDIAARTAYAAPIQTLVAPTHEVTGRVEMTAEAGKTYVVRGELGEKYSSVWIEEESTGALVGKKIEIQGW